jgi:hypothetical protein
MRLGGWQRLWIVLSVAWLLFLVTAAWETPNAVGNTQFWLNWSVPVAGVFVCAWSVRWIADGFSAVSALLLAIVVVASTAAPLGAAAPGVIMIYGAPLAAAVFLRHGDSSDLPRLANFWCGGTRGPVPTPAGFEGRAYLKVAMFWGSESWMEPSTFDRIAPTLRPERAHQHGRLYLPANDEPAVLLST